MTQKHKKVVAIIAFFLFLLFMAVAGYYVGIPMIRLAREPAKFQQLVDAYGLWGRIVFVGMVVLQVLVAFIPGEPVELVAGYAFGFGEGTLLSLLGIIIGSVLVFLLVLQFGIKLVEVFFTAEQIHSFSFLQIRKRPDCWRFS